MQKSTLFCLFAVVCFTFPVLAQESEEEAPPDPLWEGSAGLSYIATSGNTDTQSFGLDFTAKRRPTPWGYEFFALFNRAEDSSVLTAERYYAGGRALRALGDRWELFAGLSAEKDQFAGFDMRAIVEAGATYKAIKGQASLGIGCFELCASGQIKDLQRGAEQFVPIIADAHFVTGREEAVGGAQRGILARAGEVLDPHCALFGNVQAEIALRASVAPFTA